MMKIKLDVNDSMEIITEKNMSGQKSSDGNPVRYPALHLCGAF